MNKLLIVLALLSIAGCGNSATELKFPAMPEDMKDCKILRIHNDSGDALTIARCPNSTTSSTYASGKSKQSTIVIDGDEYKKLENEK